MVERAVALRDAGQLGQALQAVVIAQEKLFARPAAEFMGLGIEDQLRMLAFGESAETARAKRDTLADILQEGARIYAARGRTDLAESARALSARVRPA